MFSELLVSLADLAARPLLLTHRLLAAPCLAALLASACTAAAQGAGPRVREVVEFTRIVQPRAGDPDQLRAQVSPDGRHAFIVTRRADVATDRNLFDILLIRLDVARWQRVSRAIQAGQGMPSLPEPPVRLLTVVSRTDAAYIMPSIRDARWVGNRSIVFLGRIDDAPFQVHRLDIETRRREAMTFSAHPIVTWDVSADLARVAYVAQVPNPPMAAGTRHVVVGNRSFWNVTSGQDDLRAQDRMHRLFVAEAGVQGSERPLGQAFESSAYAPAPSLSTDGRWVLVPDYVPQAQARWAARYPIVATATERFSRSYTSDPLGYFSRPRAYVPRRMLAYRVAGGQVQTVLDAPDDTTTNATQWRSDRLWFDGGRTVILAGTHLPPQAGQGASTLSHIVEYRPDTGVWTVVAPLERALVAAYRLGGAQDAFVALDGSRRRVFVRASDGAWREQTDDAVVAAAGRDVPGVPDRVPLGTTGWWLGRMEGLNRPPDLVAWRDGEGEGVVPLTSLNPQFVAGQWGNMQPYGWTDAQGRRWEGGLMRPPGAGVTGPGPLVIQTYHFDPDRFYLDGPAAGFSSGFAGRAFLREGLQVLAMPWGPATDGPTDERGGLLAFVAGVKGAVDALVRDGLVDPARVGILGWSATGERVLNLVTFSDVPIRAASLLDGDANTLFSFTVTQGAGDAMTLRRERTNAAQPFGASLPRWVRHDPSLNTHCIRAALRIETYGPLVKNNWDLHALLRRQYKPVEMVVMPYGSHSLSRPSERMVSLQGNVDWYRFWLAGGERSETVLPGETAAALQAQYTAWRQMAALAREDAARPGCDREVLVP